MCSGKCGKGRSRHETGLGTISARRDFALLVADHQTVVVDAQRTARAIEPDKRPVGTGHVLALGFDRLAGAAGFRPIRFERGTDKAFDADSRVWWDDLHFRASLAGLVRG